MKKVCLIVPKGLPLPNVKGGAIETLVNILINQNEIYKKMDLTVVSIFDKEAYQESKKYKQTKFIYINNKTIEYYFKAIKSKLNNYVKREINTYNEIVLNKIRKDEFDYIIFEGGAYFQCQNYLKYFKKHQMVLHLHHTGYSNKNCDEVFDKLIGVSNHVIKEFSTTSSIKKSYLLKNAADIEQFKKRLTNKEKEQLRSNLKIGKEDFVILYCGRLIKEKGVLELVKAVNNTKQENIKLLIIGSINFGAGGNDEYTNQLEEAAKEKNRIILTGYINNKELYKYYNIADIQVIPSIWEEAAGIVCIEGMISKKRIITTGTGGIKEYTSDKAIFVKNDKNLTKSLTKEILNLYNNKDELSKDIEEAYKLALQYSDKEYYKNFIKLIEEDFKNEKE
jgi:spore coat protein SA